MWGRGKEHSIIKESPLTNRVRTGPGSFWLVKLIMFAVFILLLLHFVVGCLHVYLTCCTFFFREDLPWAREGFVVLRGNDM